MVTCSVMGCVVALKEIRLNSEEGTPFTAIREGGCLVEHSQTVTVCVNPSLHLYPPPLLTTLSCSFAAKGTKAFEYSNSS